MEYDAFKENVKTVRIVDLPDHLPEIEIPNEFESVEFYLCYLANEGLEKRYLKEKEENGNKWKEIKKRLDYELNIIIQMDYSNYFLIVADYVNWAKNNDIPVGAGRGTSVSSVVSYALGISDVDPIKYNLLFERFICLERIAMPYFDIYFSSERREEVIKYITEKYGNECVGRIEYTSVYVEGKLRNTHTHIHAAGIVISNKELCKIVPTYKDQTTGKTIIKCEINQLENFGLIKFDILGLKTLDVIKQTENLIQKKGVDYSEFCISNIPEDDKATYKLFSEGNTDNIFLFETGGIREVLKQAEPNCMVDLIALKNFYGCFSTETIHLYIKLKIYIKLKNSKQNVIYLDPCLEDILKETYGIIIYQEQMIQMIQIIHQVTGVSLGEAENIRRVLVKIENSTNTEQDKLLIESQKKSFFDKAKNKGFSMEKTKEIFDNLVSAADYSENKAYSVFITKMAYQTAYLKANFPNEFDTACRHYN